MDRLEVRLRALEAALMRPDTIELCFLYADLYTAYIVEDFDAVSKYASIIQNITNPPKSDAEPTLPPATPPAPLPTFSAGAFTRGRATVISKGNST